MVEREKVRRVVRAAFLAGISQRGELTRHTARLRAGCPKKACLPLGRAAPAAVADY